MYRLDKIFPKISSISKMIPSLKRLCFEILFVCFFVLNEDLGLRDRYI